MKKTSSNPATDHDAIHGDELSLTIGEDGKINMLYDDRLNPKDVDITELGNTKIERASHVEPSKKVLGEWYVDLSPSNGPIFSGFKSRKKALEFEVNWLEKNVL